MFESVKIPKRLDYSPINEAIFEIRYEGNYPGEALYGILFDIFTQFPNRDAAELPIMQLPKSIRDNDPSLRYQAFYRAANNQFAFSIGPHSIVFSTLKPYPGWAAWNDFFNPILEAIKEKKVIQRVERTGLRYFNLFESNIFEQIYVELTIERNALKTSPVSFCVEFDLGKIHSILNIGNAFVINSSQTQSLIDVDCIYPFGCEAELFFSSYQDALEKTHQTNEQIFFGLLKEDLLAQLKPEY